MSEQDNKVSAATVGSDKPVKKASKKKAAGKKTTSKAVKKTAASKTAAKKSAAKKTAGKKTAGKKAAGKKAAGAKPAAEQAKVATAPSTAAAAASKLDEAAGKVSVTLIRSPNGCIARHQATVRGLGLRRMHNTVKLENTSAIRGMLRQVAYLVRVEQL